MKLDLRPVMNRAARRLQAAYARHVRGARRRERGGRSGGTISDGLMRADLVEHKRWGFVFTPSRIGRRFLWWWNGTRHQPARGVEITVDDAALKTELEAELTRQLEAIDRRTK